VADGIDSDISNLLGVLKVANILPESENYSFVDFALSQDSLSLKISFP